MNRRFILVLLFVAACAALGVSAQAGAVFDELLNAPVVDSMCPKESIQEEAMGLTGQGKATFVGLTKDSPLGQTFTIGPNATMLWRISAGLCHWPDSWQKGEEVTLTLWDSPKKAKKLYSRFLDYDHKWSKWDVAFDTHVPVRPGAVLYFEFTFSGGGDGKVNVASIPGDEYKGGSAYVAGKPQDYDLYFVAVVKNKADRVANVRKFISQFNLDYPPLAEAKKAYEKGDLDGTCLAILEEFQTRTTPDSLLLKPVWSRRIDLTQANHLCDENRFYKNPRAKDVWMDIDEQYTWREVWPESANYMSQNELPWVLGRAYQATQDEKYARKMNDVLADYIQDNTSPLDGGMRGARWVAMHIAWRLNDAWSGFGAACRSKGLTDDVKLGWLNYLCRAANFSEHAHSGGNHANAVGESMMQFGYRFPEYKQSEEWKKFGFDKLVENSRDLFYKDGACREPTMNYHGFSIANLMSGMDMARTYGYTVPEDINGIVERALVYTSYMLDPRGIIPSVGDTDCSDFRANVKLWQGWRQGEALKASTLFGRKDCQYISSVGKEGTRPANSCAFPDIGHYILRSDWGGEGGAGFEDARWMLLRAGHYGSHGHWDSNSLLLYAYGKHLLIDPGRTDYDNPLMPVLAKNTSHNVLLVDEQKMNRVGPTVNAWHTTPVLDLIDVTYKKLYTNVDHRRAVVLVRPGYYIVFDNATATEPHKMGINFWLTPPDVTIDKAECSVRSNEPDGANVLVKQIDPAGITIADRHGSLDLDGIRNDIPVVTFWKQGLMADFTTLLYPYPKGANADGVKVRTEPIEAGRVCRIETPSGVDFVHYLPVNDGKKIEDLGFGGRAWVVKTSDGKNVTSFALLDGSQLTFEKETLASSGSLVPELSVSYTADAMEVTCPSTEPTLQIATLGRTKAVVNGKEIAVSGKMFKPF